MTVYTMKKLLNCLVRDSNNENDLIQMFKEAIKEKYESDDITDEELIVHDTDGPDWEFRCTVWQFDDDMASGDLVLNNDDLARILV